MKIPSLKHRKPIVYISLGIFATLVSLIIAESCIVGGASGVQSGLFAQISAFFVNLIKGPQIAEVIKPSSIGTVSDSSYLGNGKIALGTTTLLSIEVKYPEKKDIDVYDKSYVVSDLLGNKDDYNLVMSSHESKNSYFVDVRIVANAMTSEAYALNIKVADSLNYRYDFNIVERAKPVNYDLKIGKTTLKTGETSKIDTKLNPKEGNNRNDYYLRRLYDYTKLDHSSSNEAIATIDKYGVIHAISEGSASITYGKETYNITVTSEHITKPATNSIALNATGSASMLDYDYVFTGEDNPDDYSVLIHPTFENTTLEDQSVSYYLSDELGAIIAPFKYDENGFPVYKDDENKDCVRVCGYRKKGNVKLTVVSNNDNTIKQELDINVGEALPASMTINQKETKEVYVNDQLQVSGIFTPKNVSVKAINVTGDSDKVQIVGNGTELVTIKAKDVGKVHITVTSVANETLKQEFDINISVKQAINDDNYSNFHQWMRKFGGHFMLFLVTAIFGLLFFYTYFEDYIKLYLYLPLTLFVGFLTAGLSELIQLCVPSRSGTWMDVGIDFFGYVVGTAITFLVITIIHFIKKAKNKSK
ncbi:MAG: VanZ family protein [Bacilli bacterium]|nr:VanZ family protein [Bacilli bacterium]